MSDPSSTKGNKFDAISYPPASFIHDGQQENDIIEATSTKSSHTVTKTDNHIEESEQNEPPKPTKTARFKKFAKTFIKQYWFLMGLAIVIVLAWRFPGVAKQDGVIHSEWSIKWGAVIVIFLISGLSLRTRILAKTIMRVRLHLMIQVISLVIIPFTVYGIALFFAAVKLPINHMLLLGLVIAGCTPTTVSSNVVMTKNAKGNEASALMNAALGNVLGRHKPYLERICNSDTDPFSLTGIFVSPAMMTVFEQDTRIAPATSSHGSLDYVDVLKNLGLTILAPLVVGQIIQWLFPRQVAAVKDKCRLGDINSIALLALVWSVFSDAIASNSFASVGAVDVVAVVIINACFYISFSMFCLLCSRLPLPRMVKTPKWVKNLRYSREDTVAVMYCGATKTVAMGVPLVSVLYQDAPAGVVGVLTTPLLLYHIEQLILGNIELHLLKAWVTRGEKKHEKEALIPTDEEHGIGLHEIDGYEENHQLESNLRSSTIAPPPPAINSEQY